MSANIQIASQRKTPTRVGSMIFRAKTVLLQVRRSITDTRSTKIVRHRRGSALDGTPIVATSKTRLWTEDDPRERFLVAGKIHNLRLAVAMLDGIEIPAGEVFSFWKQIGRASRLRGFVEGRELREGCIIPNVGGGLCQLSNALYDAALQANCEIVERHAHSQVIPGSLAEKGRDATVFWNYVDLRFRVAESMRIEAKLNSEDLIVSFRGTANGAPATHQITRIVSTPNPNSCATCEVGDCHRVVDADRKTEFGRTAFLLDDHFPEFDRYIQTTRTSNDLLAIPLDGHKFRKANYAWTTSGFRSARQSMWTTAKRSYRSRKLSAQGAARQLNLLRMYDEVARSYAKRLTYDVTHIVVQQNLLPFLWKTGQLGGRTFDVLMSALPMYEIQDQLDVAHRLHPESTTLGDFRADPDLVTAEKDALRAARNLITPHTAIASLFPRRAILVDWQQPSAKQSLSRVANQKPTIVFPASTVGRKGCYELREALRDLPVKLILLGPPIEGVDFWEGFDTERGPEDWLERADVVVLPAFVEHRPRRLLLAAAHGIPVIATPACGVERVENVVTVPEGDSIALRDAITEAICSVS